MITFAGRHLLTHQCTEKSFKSLLCRQENEQQPPFELDVRWRRILGIASAEHICEKNRGTII